MLLKKWSLLTFCMISVLVLQFSAAAFSEGKPQMMMVAAPSINIDFMKASVFVKLNATDFGEITGKKLNVIERVYFKSLQKKMKKELKKNPNATISQHYDTKEGKFIFDPVWFVIGCLIGPIGILFSYTTRQTKYKRVSAIIGTAVFIGWFGYLFLF